MTPRYSSCNVIVQMPSEPYFDDRLPLEPTPEMLEAAAEAVLADIEVMLEGFYNPALSTAEPIAERALKAAFAAYHRKSREAPTQGY